MILSVPFESFNTASPSLLIMQCIASIVELSCNVIVTGIYLFVERVLNEI